MRWLRLLLPFCVLVSLSGCGMMPLKTDAENIELARAGLEMAMTASAKAGTAIAGSERRPVTVIVPVFPAVVNHKFGAMNDMFQSRPIDVKVYVNVVE